jgi:hypothetical protein
MATKGGTLPTPEEGKGVLFSVAEKTNPKAPDFYGQIMVNGNVYKLSAWKRTSAYGELISLVHNTYTGPKDGNKFEKYPKEVKTKFDDEDVPF